MKKYYRLVLVVIMFAIGGSLSHAAPDKILTGAFDIGPGGNPQKFNPLTASAGFSWYNKYFSTLVLYDVNFSRLSGDLAESWSASPGGDILSFQLRRGVKWHDGTPFSAKDVKFTLQLAKNPESGSVFASRLRNVGSIDVPGPNTIVLRLTTPDSTMLDTLTGLMILPEHALSAFTPKDLVAADWWKVRPVGTGPFKWSKYEPGLYVELSANDEYFRGKPKLDRLVNRYFKDGDAAATALRAGEIQFTYLSADQLQQPGIGSSFELLFGASQVLNYLGFNNQDVRFKDLRIRQAIIKAINRGSIIRRFYGGQAVEGRCVYTDRRYVPSDMEDFAYDPVGARQLLKAASWDRIKGAPLELLTYYGDNVSKQVIAAIQAELSAVGVDVVPRFVDGSNYGKIVDSGAFVMVFAGQGNGPEPDVLSPALESGNSPPKGLNRMRVALPELDKFFDAGRKESVPYKRAEIYKQICRITHEQLPWLPLWMSNRFGGFSPRVRNMIWTPAPGGGRYQDHAEQWIIQ